jgi:hypothetical protein
MLLPKSSVGTAEVPSSVVDAGAGTVVAADVADVDASVVAAVVDRVVARVVSFLSFPRHPASASAAQSAARTTAAVLFMVDLRFFTVFAFAFFRRTSIVSRPAAFYAAGRRAQKEGERTAPLSRSLFAVRPLPFSGTGSG